MINRGGEKISAEEIEDLMYRLGDVELVAAVAMPDAGLGERLCVYVVPKPGRAPEPGGGTRARFGRPASPPSSSPSGSRSSRRCR